MLLQILLKTVFPLILYIIIDTYKILNINLFLNTSVFIDNLCLEKYPTHNLYDFVKPILLVIMFN